MSYQEQWNELKKRSRLYYLLLFTFLPVVGVIGILLIEVLGAPPIVFYVLAGIWMLAIAISSFRLYNWPCPYCQKRFFRTVGGLEKFAKRCANCGLPKWASDETVEWEGQ